MEYKIYELCEINKNNLSKNSIYQFINYLDTSNLIEGTISELQLLKVNVDKIPSRAKRIVKKDDILISTVRPNQKHYGIIHKLEENMIASTGFAVLTPNKSKVYPEYLYRFLIQDQITEYLQAIAETSTSAYPSIKPSVIGDLEIELPPIKEQIAIADILASLDEKIAVNNKINKKLEEMAQAIFKHWFVDFEFPNENGEPYKSSGGEMVESEMGMIPKGWNIGVLDELIEIGSGKRPSIKAQVINEELSIPLVGASSIMGYTNEFNYNEPVLVIGRVGTHGIVQRFNTKIWASDNTLVIKSKYYEYVNQILNIIDYKALNRGSTQPLITQSDIKNYKIIIPDRDYLLKYEELIGSLFWKYEKNYIENENLKTIRDTLLPKLMSGEIRVPVEE